MHNGRRSRLSAGAVRMLERGTSSSRQARRSEASGVTRRAGAAGRSALTHRTFSGRKGGPCSPLQDVDVEDGLAAFLLQALELLVLGGLIVPEAGRGAFSPATKNFSCQRLISATVRPSLRAPRRPSDPA